MRKVSLFLLDCCNKALLKYPIMLRNNEHDWVFKQCFVTAVGSFQCLALNTFQTHATY